MFPRLWIMPASLPTTSSPLQRGGGFVDAKALMAIRSLELRARVVVEGFWNGLHRSPYHGFSVEFTEYRQYSPGDDTRYWTGVCMRARTAIT